MLRNSGIDYKLLNKLSHRAFPTDNAQYDYDQCDYQQDMNKPSGMKTNESYRPTDNQDYGNDIKQISHDFLFLVITNIFSLQNCGVICRQMLHYSEKKLYDSQVFIWAVLRAINICLGCGNHVSYWYNYVTDAGT